MDLRLLGDRVLVALPPKAETQDPITGYTVQAVEQTASGLLLAKPTDMYNVETATRGIVVQLGEKSRQVDLDEALALFPDSASLAAVKAGRASAAKVEYLSPEAVREELSTLAPAPFDVELGDCVVFAPSAGEPLVEEGSDVAYVILRESDIIGVLTPKEKVA